MGPVNLRAEVEAEEISRSIIVREREELTTAIAKLRGSIGHLNREGRERLGAVFQQVDRNFQALFTRMFGGGRAHLALVGSDDPLEAGLEIYAQPPGKKLATLSLLSGGEQALTALSLIFAVFRCNPAPVCVLDEVDAPLDDANVERFCTLLEDMVRETGTRFLVVTHHPLTMARMDRLYGVTMQERGVSRLLSVDLQRAAAMVEAAADGGGVARRDLDGGWLLRHKPRLPNVAGLILPAPSSSRNSRRCPAAAKSRARACCRATTSATPTTRRVAASCRTCRNLDAVRYARSGREDAAVDPRHPHGGEERRDRRLPDVHADRRLPEEALVVKRQIDKGRGQEGGARRLNPPGPPARRPLTRKSHWAPLWRPCRSISPPMPDRRWPLRPAWP